MTSDPPCDEVGGTEARPSARTRRADRTHLVASSEARSAKTTAPAHKPGTTTGGESGTLVLRSGTPPVDQLDFDDRHDTRATESDEFARRYGDLRRDRRRDDWHKLAMGLVGFAVLAAAYLAGFIVMSRLLPHLGPWLAAKVVGLAFIAAGGGVAVQSAGRALKQRTARPRDRGPKSA